MVLFSMNIVNVFATDSLGKSEPKVYNEGTNTLELEGNFTANGSYGAIWVKDGAQIEINGGKFETSVGEGEIVVPDGYRVVKKYEHIKN